jgi:hypothetical protein
LDQPLRDRLPARPAPAPRPTAGVAGLPRRGDATIFAFACAGRDALVAMLRAGDPEAITLALRALPQDLDRGFCRGVRDQKLRDAAGMLRAAMPRASEHAIAALLASAGEQLDRGGSLAKLRGFGGFVAAEIAELERQIREALVWCVRRHDGRRWPRLRQILNLL